MADSNVNILFMQSQTYFGADSYIHSLLMENIDRSWGTVHVVCNYGTGPEKSDAAKALERIPDLQIRPTNFGTSINSRTKSDIVRDAVSTTAPTMASLAGLARYIRANAIRVIHCTEKPRDAFYGQLLAKLTGASSIIHLHVKAEDWISRSVLWAMAEADAIIGVSQFVTESVAAMGYDPAKTYPLLNALEADRWDPTTDGSVVREEFDIGQDVPLLLIVSRLCYWKGHTELFKALTLVKDERPDFRLLVVGEDDPCAHPGHGSYLAELRDLSTALGLEEQMIFTGFRRDIPQLMAACDLYTMPSFEEPFGMVYLEAMAMKKAVIALDNGGAREVVEDGRSGLLSPPQDIPALAANILTLMQCPEMRMRMGEYGRRRVEECFTPVSMARNAQMIYEQVLTASTAATIDGQR